MSQEWHYTSATTPGNAGSDVIITAVRLGEVGLVQEGELMTAGNAGVWVDDPNGSLDFEGQKGWRLNETACPAAATLAGTVAKTAASTTITGTGTAFTTALTVGREIVVPGGAATEYFVVSAISSDASLTVFNAAKYSASGQTATVAGMQRVWTGYIADQDIERGLTRRGGGEPFTAGRDWNLSLEDLNVFLHDRVINDTNWPTSYDGHGPNRPAESVGTRLKWLLLGGVWSTVVFDEGLVLYPITAMDKADLSGRFGDEVLNEMCQMTGFNATLYYHEATGHYALFFNRADAAVYSSPMRLTNGGDQDNVTTWAVFPDAKLKRSPRRMISGVQVSGSFPGGKVYRTLATTSYQGRWRDAVASNANLKTLALAQAYGDRYLADLSTQDQLLSATYVVPAAHVNDVMVPQRLQVKLTHEPGLAAYTWCRVLRRQIRDAVAANGEPVPGEYEVTLDLTVPAGGCISQPSLPLPTPTAYYPPLGAPGGSGTGGYYANGSATTDWANGLVVRYDNDHGITGWPNPPFASYNNADATSQAGFYDAAGVGILGVNVFKVMGSGTLTIHLRQASSVGATVIISVSGAPTPFATSDPGVFPTGGYVKYVTGTYPSYALAATDSDIVIPVSTTPDFTPISVATGSGDLTASPGNTWTVPTTFEVASGETVRLVGSYTHVTGNNPTINASLTGTVSGHTVAWTGVNHGAGSGLAFDAPDIIWPYTDEVCEVTIHEQNGSGDDVIWNSGTISGVFVQATNCYSAVVMLIGATGSGQVGMAGVDWVSNE